MATPMNTCDRCGSAVRPNASFCPNCGAPLGNVESTSGESVGETLVSGGVRPEPAPESDIFGGYSGTEGSEPGGWQAAQTPLPPASPPPASERSPFDLPPAQGSDVFNPPPSATGRFDSLRPRLPLIIGCCAGAALLGCIIIIALGSWLVNLSGG
jgi:hypothetical protein